MKRIAVLTGFASFAIFSAGAAHAASLSLSIGSGGLLNPNDGSAISVAPLATELSIGFNVSPRVTLDASFLFARDVADPTNPNLTKASYVGFRPGIRVYGGMPFSNLRPYLRVAIPVQYNADTKTADLGLLVGGGLEYRLGRTVGIFGEAIVSPYFTHDRLIPIEGRVGVTAHF
jgi:hypothetical protein